MSKYREFLASNRLSMLHRGLRGCLLVGSPFYWLAAQAKNALYDWQFKRAYSSQLLTISVGNLSVGGTGKSPAVIWIAQWLREQEIRVAILSRGYRQLEDGRNDEALEMELRLPDVPQLQHWDRIASAQLARDELEMECLVLDDGFQHRRLGRDLDIVLIDASEPAHLRQVLPRGLFREPFSGLKRAQVVMLTRVSHAQRSELEQLRLRIGRCVPEALVVEAEHRPSQLVVANSNPRDLAELSGTRILAFCGIGNPDPFFDSLEKLGAEIVGRRVWPDHHDYQREDLEGMSSWIREHPNATLVVCTMKDWVKLQVQQLGNVPLAALQIDLDLVEGESELRAKLGELTNEISQPRQS